MLKARSKKLSMLLVLAMLMTMFAGIGVASAATTYDAVTVPTIGTGTSTGTFALEVKVDQAVGISTYDVLTISLPNAITIKGTSTAAAVKTSPDATDDVTLVLPAQIPGTNVDNAFARGVTATIGNTRKTVDVRFNSYTPEAGQGLLYVYINNAEISGATEDLVATLMGNSSIFPMKNVTIGTVVSGAGTMATVKSVKTIGTAGGDIDTITIAETKNNSWKNGDVVKLKLPAGFAWAGNPAASGNWAFTGLNSLDPNNPDFIVAKDNKDSRLLTITFKNIPSNRTTTGRIDLANFGGMSSDSTPIINLAKINVEDDSVARLGDVTLNIYGDNTTDQDIIIAKMADYDVEVVEGAFSSVVAGWDSDLKDANFRIVENMPGSLIGGRNITLTLPDGAKWNTNYVDPGTGIAFDRSKYWPDLGNSAAKAVTLELIKGSDEYFTTTSANTPTVSNNGRTLRYTIDKTSDSARSIEMKKFQVSIRADFSGDLNVEVAGNAGVEGKVKIAEVVPALTIENDGKARLIIGAQNQVAGDIILKENQKEAIDTTAGDYVYLKLPDGAKWATKPTVEVTEGDIVVDSVNTDGQLLKLNFKSASSKASVIKISNVLIDTTRVMPEGNVKVTINSGSDALTDNSGENYFNISTLNSAVIGQVVTPAPGETLGAGEFVIGSNFYYVGGVKKLMDVAPYIKGERTYVPMRFLGEILGAEVVWDESARTVTLTRGDDVVVFTVGSASYTVNGEAMTADVAPEIVNDRTMLPARFVAEGFGAIVGWDPGTQTVLIQN